MVVCVYMCVCEGGVHMCVRGDACVCVCVCEESVHVCVCVHVCMTT